MTCVITGATGFIGRAAVLELVHQGHEITALVRNPVSALKEILSGQDAIIHLAGEPIAARRWNLATRQRIRDSRVLGTRELVQALALISPELRPKVLVSASAIGVYGDRGDEMLRESSSAGNDFLAEVTSEWEREAMGAESLGVRVVLLRTGVVLGRGGGVLAKMQPVVLGSGQQWMSWIHLEDEVRFISFALSNQITGPFNLVSPEPVRNKDFTRLFAKAKGVPAVLFPALRVPVFVLKGALGQMSQLLLGSARVLPEKALQAGFTFKYPDLESALAQIFVS
ncbi:TIGR01777 family oxidoreductase [Bdellovibrionota bacterium FG-2]